MRARCVSCADPVATAPETARHQLLFDVDDTSTRGRNDLEYVRPRHTVHFHPGLKGPSSPPVDQRRDYGVVYDFSYGRHQPIAPSLDVVHSGTPRPIDIAYSRCAA